jgi:hypothetical protein
LEIGVIVVVAQDMVVSSALDMWWLRFISAAALATASKRCFFKRILADKPTLAMELTLESPAGWHLLDRLTASSSLLVAKFIGVSSFSWWGGVLLSTTMASDSSEEVGWALLIVMTTKGNDVFTWGRSPRLMLLSTQQLLLASSTAAADWGLSLRRRPFAVVEVAALPASLPQPSSFSAAASPSAVGEVAASFRAAELAAARAAAAFILVEVFAPAGSSFVGPIFTRGEDESRLSVLPASTSMAAAATTAAASLIMTSFLFPPRSQWKDLKDDEEASPLSTRGRMTNVGVL